MSAKQYKVYVRDPVKFPSNELVLTVEVDEGAVLEDFLNDLRKTKGYSLEIHNVVECLPIK